MIAMLVYGISPSGAEAAGTVRDSSRDAGAAGTATMTASATRYSGSAAEPTVSRQPASVRVSSRTMALTRTSAVEALATASGSAPIPVVSETNTAAGSLLLSGAGSSGAAGSSEVTASVKLGCCLAAAASGASVASKDSCSERPA